MISITLGLFLLSFIPGYLFKNKFYKFMLNHNKIEDELIARRFKKPIKKVREELFELSQKQMKKRWLIIFLDKHYVFYNQETIDKFAELYNKGFNEKEILNNLTDFKLATRNEIKVIKESLLKLERLSEREVTVKEYSEKQRFED